MNRAVTQEMKPHHFLRSGTAILRAIRNKRGAPSAALVARFASYLSTTNTHLCLYAFAPVTAGNPSNAVYEWDFGDGRKLRAPAATWLYPPGADQTVTLTVTAGNQPPSRCTRTFFPKFTLDPAVPYDAKEKRALPEQAFSTNVEDRATYAAALAHMVAAAPSASAPPTAGAPTCGAVWTPSPPRRWTCRSGPTSSSAPVRTCSSSPPPCAGRSRTSVSRRSAAPTRS